MRFKKHWGGVVLGTVLTYICFGVSAQKIRSVINYEACPYQPALQIQRSKELQSLAETDQKVRLEFEKLSQEERFQMMKDDLLRRRRVGEIMGEGCLKTAADFAAAALIYQHGDVPEHYFQSFVWANRAVQLGDQTQAHLAAAAIDRYLVSIGKKQLFASQGGAGLKPGACFCLQQTERSFPDARRKSYSGHSLQKGYEMLAIVNKGKKCPNVECSAPLKPSPKGTVPGFW